MFFVYIIKSVKNGRYYVGTTGKNPDLRLKDHNLGSNQWSKTNRPFKLVYYESYHCKTDALHREKFYKSGFGREIRKLIIDYIEKFGE